MTMRYAQTRAAVRRARLGRGVVAHVRADGIGTSALCGWLLDPRDIDPAAPGVTICRECAAKARREGQP